MSETPKSTLLSVAEYFNREKIVTDIGGYTEFWTLDYFRDMVEAAGLKIIEVGTGFDNRVNVIVARKEEKKREEEPRYRRRRSVWDNEFRSFFDPYGRR